MIEYRESDIFINIPMIMIIKSCDGEDKGICEIFLPGIKDPNSSIGSLYHQVTETLFENNHLFVLKQDKEAKPRTGSLTRSLKFSRKTPGVSPEKKSEESNPHAGHFGSSSPKHTFKYKTILGNKAEYTGQLRLKREEADKEKPAPRKLDYLFYNLLEKLILSIDLGEKEKLAYKENAKSLDSCIIKVKTLSIELERRDPVEWNTFLDVALES